jgi:hypothetical protein
MHPVYGFRTRIKTPVTAVQIKRWMTHYLEVAPSTYRPGRIDHVYNANAYLKMFKHTNAERLSRCVTHREYVWSVREKTPVRDRAQLVFALFFSSYKEFNAMQIGGSLNFHVLFR